MSKEILRKNGLANSASIAQAAIDSGVELAIAAAFAERESRGEMIYGHDADRTFSTRYRSVTTDGITYPIGSDIPVTKGNYADFYQKVMAGAPSNGVGIFQLTYAGPKRADGTQVGGFLSQALSMGFDLSDPLDNSRYALSKIIKPYLKGLTTDAAILEAATRYNSGSWNGTPNAYGNGVLSAVKKWRSLIPATVPAVTVPVSPTREHKIGAAFLEVMKEVG